MGDPNTHAGSNRVSAMRRTSLGSSGRPVPVSSKVRAKLSWGLNSSSRNADRGSLRRSWRRPPVCPPPRCGLSKAIAAPHFDGSAPPRRATEARPRATHNRRLRCRLRRDMQIVCWRCPDSGGERRFRGAGAGCRLGLKIARSTPGGRKVRAHRLELGRYRRLAGGAGVRSARAIPAQGIVPRSRCPPWRAGSFASRSVSLTPFACGAAPRTNICRATGSRSPRIAACPPWDTATRPSRRRGRGPISWLPATSCSGPPAPGPRRPGRVALGKGTARRADAGP